MAAGAFCEVMAAETKRENKVSLSQIQMGTKIVRKQLPLAAGGVAEGIQSKHTETENMIK